MAIIYRTLGAWGPGKGADLTAAEVDGNFYDHEGRIADLETNPPDAVSIDTIDVTGNLLTITMTDASVQGPFVIPTTRFRWVGEWLPSVEYFENDVFFNDLSIYVVLFDHTSATTFDAERFDSVGFIYQEMIAVPDAFMDIGFFYPGQPASAITFGEDMFAFRAVRSFYLPQDLTDSRAGFGVAHVHDQTYSILKNGIVIGTWSPDTGFAFTADVQFSANDVLSVVAPLLEYDETARDLTMTLVGVRGLIPA